MKKLFSTLLMGVFILTSVSVFTSCKDNDDDIKAIREDVAALRAELTNVKAALETELQSSKSQFETQIAQVKKELQDAIDKKADEATVSALREKLTGLETDYSAKLAVLETQIETANNALAKLDEKADKATVDNVIANLAALTGQLSDESKAREALEANLAIQIEALKKLRQELTDANYQGQIDGLIQACQNFETTVGDVSTMKKTINNLELELTAFNQYISALTVLVERQLNSISLVPQLFVGGIEAIEFVDLQYVEFQYLKTAQASKYTFILDKGETEATYRLNPSTTPRDGIDESGIEFLAATAEVVPEYMFAPAKTRNIEYIPSPVLFNGIKSYKNGLMTVYLKKRDRDFNINWHTKRPTDPDSIYIVALKVPRNASQYEAADVISENSRLVEIVYTPRIAAVPNGSRVMWHADWSGTEKYYDGLNNDESTLNIDRPIHYWSEQDIWGPPSGMRIDARPLQGVSKIVDYNKTFDVKTIVTGCLQQGGYDGTCVKEATPAELKKFGIVYRYSIPTRVYNIGANHDTDQQQFASITVDGIISAKTPAGVTDNKAVIGKEPVVKIQMVDTTRNKVVDERYLKIKWSDERERYEDLYLFDKVDEVTLNPCNTTNIPALTWRYVIDQIYAKITKENIKPLEGVSEKQFADIYLQQLPTIEVSWTTNWPSNYSSLTSAPNQGVGGPAPVFVQSPNIHGDAVLANWSLEPSDIKTVYCSSQSDTKTFTAKVTYKSIDHRYPTIWFNWKVTIKLPKLPEIVGHYEQYWYENYAFHDILPLQYQSDIQKWWEFMSPVQKNYCFFDNNMMNPFVYDESANSYKLIVKNIPECGSWDIQFAYNQSIPNHKPYYTPNAVNNDVIATPQTWDDIYNTGNNTRIYRSGGLDVDTHNFDNLANLIPWQNFGAYQYWKIPYVPGPQKLQMAWTDNDGDNINPLTLTNHEIDGTHRAWFKSSNIRDRRCYMRTIPEHYTTASDWNNDYLKSLLNELDPNPANDLTRPDGTKEPARTHTKAIDMNIWGALNAWNYIPVKSYKAYLIAPLRFNVLNGLWYDGQVNGSPVNWYDLISLTDFRGYSVARATTGTSEQQRWARELWQYYEVQEPNILTDQARFALKVENGNVIIDNNMPISSWMTSQQLHQKTNGNVDISFEQNGSYIYFWNNGGSRIEGQVKVYLPVVLDYGLGRFDGRQDPFAYGIQGWVKPHVEPFE